MLPNRQVAFEKLIKIGRHIGEAGLDLLSKCLKLNPDGRITAKQALQH